MKLSQLNTLNRLNTLSLGKAGVRQNRLPKPQEVRSNSGFQRLSDYEVLWGGQNYTAFGSKKYDYFSDLSDRIGSVNNHFINQWLVQSQNEVFNRLKDAGYDVKQNPKIDEKY